MSRLVGGAQRRQSGGLASGVDGRQPDLGVEAVRDRSEQGIAKAAHRPRPRPQAEAERRHSRRRVLQQEGPRLGPAQPVGFGGGLRSEGRGVDQGEVGRGARDGGAEVSDLERRPFGPNLEAALAGRDLRLGAVIVHFDRLDARVDRLAFKPGRADGIDACRERPHVDLRASLAQLDHRTHDRVQVPTGGRGVGEYLHRGSPLAYSTRPRIAASVSVRLSPWRRRSRPHM